MSNNFSFCGRLGRDSELKALPSGDAILNFNVANDVGYGNKKQTLWVSCALFGKRAETMAQYLKKGQSVFVSGELRTREYPGKDGLTRTSLEMSPNVVDFVGSKQEGSPLAPKMQEPDNGNYDDFDDDICF